MAVKRTPQGTWQVRWRDPTGRQRSKTYPRKEDADNFEHETLAAQRRGDWLDPDLARITLTAWTTEWLAGAHNLRPKTLEVYRGVLGHVLPVLGDMPIGRITATHIDEYLAAKAKTHAPSTVHRHYRTLRRIFRVAVQRGRIRRSPLATVQEPRIPRTEITVITAPQLEALADTIDNRYRTLVLVAGWSGPRWGELAGLRVRRVDVDGNRLHIVEQRDPDGRNPAEPKTDAGRRWVSVPGSVMDEVATVIAGKAPDDLVWTSPQGMPMRNATFRLRYFQPACIATGLGRLLPADPADPDAKRRYEGLTPHDLRHTSVALAIAEGAHPKAIQARMGHSTIAITLDMYGHLFPEIDTTLAGRLDDTRTRALTERRRLRVV